jgi:HK97 family phage prohead protease
MTVFKFLPSAASVDGLAEKRQVLVTCSTEGVDRQGDIIVQAGIDTSSFMRTGGTVLWQHDPDQPIAKCLSIGVENGSLKAMAQFPEAGISPKADEIYGLVRAGIINATSIGFAPLQSEPIDPKDPWAGRKYTAIELMEFSFVSVPANSEATIIARSNRAKADEVWKVGASRNLPLGGDEAWDGPAAQESIFNHCGFDGDKPDVTMARKGFLVYDSAKPKEKGSYKLPFAKMEDGRMTAIPAGIRAAASRLPQTDIPEDVQKKARAVIDHYEAKMKGDDAKAFRVPGVKGLYDVAYLAQLLMSLGYLHNDSLREAEVEGDNSPLPAMLANALKVLADAFLAMSKEEVAELLAGHDVEIEDDDPAVASAATPMAKRWASALAKAGRALSEENIAHVKAIKKCIMSMQDCQTKALDSHADTHDHLEQFVAHLNDAHEHVKALMQKAKKKPNPADGDDGDGADEDGEGEGANDDADVELSSAAARRKRMIEIAAKAI